MFEVSDLNIHRLAKAKQKCGRSRVGFPDGCFFGFFFPFSIASILSSLSLFPEALGATRTQRMFLHKV